ncbi:uncharacterized protein APUU_50655A [Aspergillus puulaauensis]|uniref:Uncharacterized protein n=1 Tax=Aspergillus puulaauensis TaxID=1220207 RepID=A0A7R8ANG3_9EURO|nr:uncharacterized protein APUU_50655A [Aspergillus puulaauensis]BCS25944.1 hypothetical protein APUU_50655A [Aspergillus puulaauensis]
MASLRQTARRLFQTLSQIPELQPATALLIGGIAASQYLHGVNPESIDVLINLRGDYQAGTNVHVARLAQRRFPGIFTIDNNPGYGLRTVFRGVPIRFHHKDTLPWITSSSMTPVANAGSFLPFLNMYDLMVSRFWSARLRGTDYYEIDISQAVKLMVKLVDPVTGLVSVTDVQREFLRCPVEELCGRSDTDQWLLQVFEM